MVARNRSREVPGMPFWQRLLITLVAMVVTSLLVGLIWRTLFGFELPSYLGGSDRRSDRGAGVGVPQAHRTRGATPAPPH